MAQDPPAKRAKFASDLPSMMYGFGDDPNPLEETVDLMEDMLIDYLRTLTEKSVAQNGGNPDKLRLEHILLALRKDRPKFNRAKELLACDKLIRQYRKSAAPRVMSVGRDAKLDVIGPTSSSSPSASLPSSSSSPASSTSQSVAPAGFAKPTSSSTVSSSSSSK